jgi:hypothetical protein
MDTVLRLLFYEMLGLGLIATVVKSFSWRDYVRKARPGPQTRLLRSPGDSYQRETQVLNDWLMGLLAGIVATPAILLGQMPHTIDGKSIAIMAVSIVAWAVPLIYLLNLRRKLELALRGQRAVAEELNRLMREGCYVFHDYPTGPKQTIDHVIVSGAGVFAIKTQTWRKRSGSKSAAVSYDGACLNFSGGATDTQSLDLACRDSADLSRELTAALAEAVNVSPIVAIPGWLVSRTGDGEVRVLAPEEVGRAVITSEKPVLNSAQMQKLATVVEQKCRDVDL